MKTVHFRFGDALRAIAIVLVVLSHVAMVVPFLTWLVPYRVPMGDWGVDAFFVLSGFLLGRPYVDAILGRRPLPNWKAYASRRFLRIWPAYAAVVVFATAKTFVHHGGNAFVVEDTATHLLMIHNFFPAFVGGVENIALWTMAVDAQFYLILPIVAWFLYARKGANGQASILIALAILLAVSLSWRVVTALLTPGTDELVLTIQRNVIGLGMCFVVGAFLAYLAALGADCPKRFARWLVALAIVLTVADFAAAAMLAPAFPLASLCYDVLGTIAVGLIVFAMPHVELHALDAALDSRIVVGFAANAYALYLVHVPIKLAIAIALTGRHIAEGTTRYGLLFTAAFLHPLCDRRPAPPPLHRGPLSNAERTPRPKPNRPT